MKTITFAVSFLVTAFALTSHAQNDVDAYVSFLQNPALLTQRADDPKAAQVQELIESLAPEIHFHPEEKFPPMDPLEFIERSSLHRGSFKNSVEVAGTGKFTPASLTRLDESYFLRLEGPRNKRLEKPAPLIWELSGTKLMNHLPSRPGARWVMIDFWFTNAFNEALFLFKLGDHQGEWEGQGFLVELSTDSEGKLQYRLGAAYYAHHQSGTWLCPGELEWTEGAAGEGHPRAYAAHGTHASYAKAGKFGKKGGLLGFDFTANGGLVLQGWENLRPLKTEPYSGFRGGWGSRGLVSVMNGPEGPNSTKFYPRETDENALSEMAEHLQDHCGIDN